MNKRLCIIFTLFIYSCKESIHSYQNSLTDSKNASIQTFFDSTFDTYNVDGHSHIFKLVKDSLKLKCMNSTLFSVSFMGSHGTDYTIIRDDLSKRFFILPQNRGNIQKFYNIATLTLLVTDSIGPTLPPLEPMEYELIGIEQFINQSSMLKNRSFSLEELDTLLQFKKTYDLGDRIYTTSQLVSAFEKVFPNTEKFSKSENEQIRIIKSALKSKLETKQALIYYASNFYLNVYEINPSAIKYYSIENYKKNFLFNNIRSYNLRKIEIGINRELY